MSDVRLTEEEMKLARLAAATAVIGYGEFTVEEWTRYNRDGIWNDHPAVQAAIEAIKLMKEQNK